MKKLLEAKIAGFYLCGLFIGLLCVNSVISSPCNLRFQFACRSNSNRCIPLSQIRDGKKDCPDGSDEESSCPDDFFQCRSGNGCVPRDKVRDGFSDCLDGSDEECPPGMHRCRCGVPKCVDKNLVGDGVENCLDGSDEGEDNSNFLCPESSGEDLFAIEKKKRRRRNVEEDHRRTLPTTTFHKNLNTADGSQLFGSLNSGKVYLTAMNEPKSSLSTSVITTNEMTDKIEGNEIRNDPTDAMETSASTDANMNPLVLSRYDEGRDLRLGNVNRNKYLDRLSPSRPMVITRYIEPTAVTEQRARSASHSGRNDGEVRRNSTTLRGHFTRSRQFKLYNPSSVAARRVPEDVKETIINDDSLLPLQTNQISSSSAYDPGMLAYYKVGEERPQHGDSLVNTVEFIPHHPTMALSDKRLTRTVGLYGPIYDNYYDAHTSGTKSNSATKLLNDDSNVEDNETEFDGGKTITLFGFAQFSTKISGTNYVFMPASTQPRTFTPRVSVTKVPQEIPSSSWSSVQSPPLFSSQKAVFHRRPLFGTTMRELMITSTAVKPIQPVQKTSLAHAVVHNPDTKNRARILKMETETKLAETLPLDFASLYRTDSDKTDLPANPTDVLSGKEDTRTKDNLKDLHVSHIVDEPSEVHETFEHPTGLVSSLTGTEVNDDATTHWTTLIFGTYIDNTYAHVIESTSSIFYTVSKTSSVDDSFMSSQDMAQSGKMPIIPPSMMDSPDRQRYGEPMIDILPSLRDVQNDPSSALPTERLYSSTEQHILKSGFILPSITKEQSVRDQSDISLRTTSEESKEAQYRKQTILPRVVYVGDSDEEDELLVNGFVIPVKMDEEEIESLKSRDLPMPSNDKDESIVLLTGDFILPQKLSLSKNPSYNKPTSIITDGFIFPGFVKMQNNHTLSISSDKLSTLTDGFILPEQMVASTTTQIPSLEAATAEPLVAIYFAPEVTNKLDEVQTFARNAGDEEKEVVLDDFIQATPTTVSDLNEIVLTNEDEDSDENLEDPTNNSLSDRENKAIKGRPQPTASNDEKQISIETPLSHDRVITYYTTFVNDGATTVETRTISQSGSSQVTLGLQSSIPNQPVSLSTKQYTTLTYLKTLLIGDTSTIITSKSVISDRVHSTSTSKELKNSISPTSVNVRPTTYYTTYTYYTTFHKDGTTSVNTRLETVSNIVNGAADSNGHLQEKPIIKTTEVPILQSSKTDNKPTTYFTTYTYYTTYLRGGHTIVSSREEILSSITGTSSESIPVISSTERPQEHLATYPLKTTFYTTYTYYTTLLKQGTTTVSTRKETITNVLHGSTKPSDEIKVTQAEAIVATPVVKTYFTTYTYYTTYLREGSPLVSSRESIATQVVTESETTTKIEPSAITTRTFATYFTTLTSYYTLYDVGAPSISTVYNTLTDVVAITPTLHPEKSPTLPPAIETYFTTYTYYTTLLHSNTPVVSSREETITNVVTRDDSTTKDATTFAHIVTPVIFDRSSPINNELNQFSAHKIRYTTYTYFTTFLINDTPTVSTNYRTITNHDMATEHSEPISATKSHRPNTQYTTYTYYATEMKNGVSTVHQKTHVVSNVLDPSSETSTVSAILPTATTTLYTTYTYYTTLFSDSTSITETRLKTVTNVITHSRPMATSIHKPDLDEAEGEYLEKSVHLTPVFPYYTTRTYVTASLKPDGETQYETRRVSALVSIQSSHNIIDNYVSTAKVENTPEISSVFVPCCETYPRTDYTTYTYYTTRFHGGKPQINTRYETLTNVVKSAIESTKPIEIPSEGSRVPEVKIIFNEQLLPRNDIDDVRSVRKETDELDLVGTLSTSAESSSSDGNTSNDAEANFTSAETETEKYITTESMNSSPDESTVSSSDETDGISTEIFRENISTNAESSTDVNIKTTTDTDEGTTTTEASTTTRRVVFGLRRNRPVFRPRPTARAFTTSTSTTPSNFRTTTAKSALPFGRRNTTRVLFRRPIPQNRTFPLRRLRRPGSVPVPTTEIPENRKKRSLYEISKFHESIPSSRKLLNVNYNEAYTVSIQHNDLNSSGPRGLTNDQYPLGLLRSVEAREINDGTTTVYATEIHGTFVNGEYAQVVQSKVRLFSDPSIEIEKTAFPIAVHPTPALRLDETPISSSLQKVLVSSIIHTTVHDGTPTVYATNIYGTYIGNVYAHIAQTTSSIVTPSINPYATGLISSTVNTRINDGTATAWTTNFYGTFVNGYYAHVAQTTSNVVSELSKLQIQPTLLPAGFQNQIYASVTHMPDSSLTEKQQDQVTDFNASEINNHKTGLLSSFVSDLVNSGGTTTQFITNVYGTFIGQQYAQHVQTTSKIVLPTVDSVSARSVGLVSTLVRTVVNDNTATLYRTDVYGTYIGDFYAQVARTSTDYSIITTSITPTRSQRTGLVSSTVIRSDVFDGTTTLHLNEIYGTYIGDAYAHIAKSTTRVITPPSKEFDYPSPSKQKTGLVSSNVKKEVNYGTTTLYTTEVHGTYIGNYYAHVARTTSNILPFSTEHPILPETTTKTEGLISSEVRTEINFGTTTLHTKEIHGTSINGYYAHVARSTSNIIQPKPISNTGLVSAITSSYYKDGTLTLYTTEIYGTNINGYYAHIARTTSNIVSTPLSIGLISAVTSTEVNNYVTTLYETSTIGSVIDGQYSRSIQITSTVLSSSSTYLDFVALMDRDQAPRNILHSEDIDSAGINQVDSENNRNELESAKILKSSLFGALSYSLNSENVLQTNDKITPSLSTYFAESFFEQSSSYPSNVNLDTTEQTIALRNLESSSIRLEPSSKKLKEPPQDIKTTSLPTDFEDYNDDINENKNKKEKIVSTSKPFTRTTVRSRNDLDKNKSHLRTLRRNNDKNHKDYDDYDFEDDYDDFDDRRISKNLLSSAPITNVHSFGSKMKSSSIYRKDYDDYEEDDEDIYDYHDSIIPTPIKTSRSASTKVESETVSSSVKIRPFTGRGRPTFGTPVRTTSTKSSFTIQFRRPSRSRNSLAFGQRSDSNSGEDFDDEESEENDGDIEASEAVVTTATPQALPPRRNKFRSSSSRQQTSSRTTTQSPRSLSVRRNQRVFGRSSATLAPTQSYKNIREADYDENTTEDEDFDEFDDIYEKASNEGSRNSRFTRRPASRRAFGERRSASNKRGAFRHREEEEIENDEFDVTTPDYRNSRNRSGQRKSLRNRQNRNRSPSLKASFNSVSREEDEESLQPINRINRNRNRRPSYNPRTKKVSKTAADITTAVIKPHLTVTSVVTTIKTLPIYHGFRTSYATLTTTALDTSIINPSQYSTVVSDGLTKTLYSSKVGYPDGYENLHTTITEVVITTTSLASVKLVPIKIGFSTRTDTITDIQVLTTLSTVYSTITPDAPTPTAFPQQFQPQYYPQLPPQNPDFGLLTSVATQIVTSTTIVPIILRGRTILSTLTTTSTAQSTVVQTPSLRIPQVPSAAPFIHQPYFAFQPLTTLLTLYVTGEHGELKPVVTTVTVPLYQQPVFHTKVARSLQNSASYNEPMNTENAEYAFRMPNYLESSLDVDIGTHYDKLLSSGLEEINDLSEVTSSSQTEPLNSMIFTKYSDKGKTYDVTTISKGPLTEIYAQKATESTESEDVITKRNIADASDEKYGIGSKFSRRKLQQFLQDDTGDFRPQRDFTRIRRPHGVVFRTSAADTGLEPSRSFNNNFDPNTFRIPTAEVFTGDNFNPNSFRPITRDAFRAQNLPRHVPARPPANFRTFIGNPAPANFVPNEPEIPISRGHWSHFSPQPLDEIYNQPGPLGPVRVANDNFNIFPNNVGFRPNNVGGVPTRPSISSDVNSFNTLRRIVTRPVSNGISRTGGIRRITRTRPLDTSTSRIPTFENDLSFLPVSTHTFDRVHTSDVVDDEDNDDDEEEDDDEDPFSSDYEAIVKISPSATETSFRRSTIRKTVQTSLVLGDGSGSRRPVVVRRTRLNTASPSSQDEINTSPTITPSSVRPDLLPSEIDEFENVTPGRRIVRLRKPDVTLSTQPAGQRRRIVVSRKPQSGEITPVQGRGPVTKNNDIDDSNNLVGDDDLIKSGLISKSSIEKSYLSRTFPITYLTTLTYFTTFLHGSNINYSSRQAVFSNIIEQTLNPSIISIIKTKEGYIVPSTGNKIVPLASRTLGDTTTIVNLASRQNLYNSEVYSLLGEEDVTSIVTTTLPNRPTRSNGVAQPSRQVSVSEINSVNLDDIASLPKTYVTLFTYLYTFYDGENVRQSARSETITKADSDPTHFISATVGSSIDGFGFATVGPETKIVQLGSREVEGTTTEVNLDLKTLVHFDNLRNVLIQNNQPSVHIIPTRTVSIHPQTESYSSAVSSSLNDQLLQPSYPTDNELYGSRNIGDDDRAQNTPALSNIYGEYESTQHNLQPVLKVTSIVHGLSGALRSGVFTPRPGVRVRVRPVTSKKIPLSSSVSDDSPFVPDSMDVLTTTPIYDPNMGITESGEVYTDTDGGHDNEVVSHEAEVPEVGGGVAPPRKRLKITVRRQPSESISRTHTRFVLPSRFEITSRPRFYVVTRTGALGIVPPSQRPFTVKISRKLKPSADLEDSILHSSTIIYETYTTLTTVPVIFGLETSFRNIIVTTSSPVTVTAPITSTAVPPLIQPSNTVVLTYFTTTTYTIPYLDGDQTLYTFLEETNSRVVTQTFDGLESLTYSTVSREQTSHPTMTQPGMSPGIFPSQSASHMQPQSSSVPTIPSRAMPEDMQFETKTFYTTYTLFTTFYSGTDAFISSSEQVLSHVVTVPAVQPTGSVPDLAGPVTVFDTSHIVSTKTVLNTVTFYATLFSDTGSFVTPIEEVQTQIQTVTDTITVTRTIQPTSSLRILPTSIRTIPQSQEKLVTLTQTLYTTQTNFVTLFQDTGRVVTDIEEVVSNVVTLTLPATDASAFSYSTTRPLLVSPEYTTREVLSTQTHYLTLFSGDQQLLSTLEEVVTNYVTEKVAPSSMVRPKTSAFEYPIHISPSSSIRPHIESTESKSKVQTYQQELVPSIRTLYSTLTFYTTYFSGTSSIIASQEEVLTSYVTLFVPPSLITSTETKIQPSATVPILTATTDPSVFVFTTTDYSTLTLYTTLFNGDQTVVISSEHVVPDIITATITPTPTSVTKTFTSEASVLTFLTTFTYYTTYFSGVEPVIASSESVVTQYITIDSVPTTTSSLATADTEISTTPVEETIIGVATISGSNIETSISNDHGDDHIIGISSTTATESEPEIDSSVSIITKIQTEVGSSVHEQPVFITSSVTPDKFSVILESSERASKISTETLETVKEGSTVIFFTDILLPTSQQSTEMLPMTSSSIVSESTEIIGMNGKITTLPPKATLMLVTGTDGFVTRYSGEMSSPTFDEVIAKIEPTSSDIKPATVIELSDLLGGSTALGGDIGLAIKDIVSLITGKKNKTENDGFMDFFTTTESTSLDDVTQKTTEITEKTTPRQKSTTLTDSDMEDNKETTKDIDYPVFVLQPPAKKTEIGKPIPVYVPVELSPSKPKESTSSTAGTEKSLTPTVKPTVSTSVITGARTVFIIPSRASVLQRVRTTSITKSAKSEESLIIVPTTTSSTSSTTKLVQDISSQEQKVSLKSDDSKVSSIPDTTTVEKIESIIGRANIHLESSKPATTTTTAKAQDTTILSRTVSGATTIFLPGRQTKQTISRISTRYVTSVESITRTLALTTTRTYYTRDSTFTVPSVYTTTIPPRTFVSTIIGKRTILGILPEPTETILHKTIQPSERTTTVTTTTLIFNSIPSTVIRTLVLPTIAATQGTSDTSETSTSDSEVFGVVTEKPANPPESADSTLHIHSDTSNVLVGDPHQKQRDETYLRAANPRVPEVNLAGIQRPPLTIPPLVKPQDDPFMNGRNGVCDPKCLPHKKEMCSERNGFWKCRCRPGHARKDDHEICREIQSFLLLVKVKKMYNSTVEYQDSLSDPNSREYKNLAETAKEGISEVYHYTNVRDHYLGAEVNDIMPANSPMLPAVAADDKGVIVNLTLQVTKSVSKKLLEQELQRSLQMSAKRVGDSLLLAAPLSQSIQDFDECSNLDYNDCSPRASCENIEGSYTCQCKEGFEDKDTKSPGRTCFEKTENCEFCYGRGDCLTSDDNQVYCRCLPMYVGRRCEINGLVLAVALPTAVAVLVVLLCVILCCCRKCRRKSATGSAVDPSLFRGIALKGPVGGTLDRKAMIDSSSESSLEHGKRNLHSYDGFQESGDVTPIKDSKRSDISLNRSLSTNYAAAPVMIPRAKSQGSKASNYTVYNGQVYVW